MLHKDVDGFGITNVAEGDDAILNDETPREKWNRGLDLYIESVHKPDNQLRSCAHNQKCYHELMQIREHVLAYLHTMKDSEFYREWTTE